MRGFTSLSGDSPAGKLAVCAVVTALVVVAVGPAIAVSAATTDGLAVVGNASPIAQSAPETTTDSENETDSETTTDSENETDSGDTSAWTTTTGVGEGTDAADAPNSASANTSTNATTVPGTTVEQTDTATSTRTVVLRLQAADIPQDASRREAIAALRAKAERTQQSVLAFADNTSAATIQSRFWLTNAVVLQYDTDRLSASAVRAIDGIEEIHPNFQLSGPDPFDVPPRVRASANESVRSSQGPTTYGLAQINAPATWERFDTRGEGVTVAVLDTGVDAAHPDIDLFTEDPSDPTYPGGWAEFNVDGQRVVGSVPNDPVGHGTHVSGTVAGGDESGQHIGVAPNATLLHGLVLNPDGNGGSTGTFAQIIAGMQWAVTSDADVLSMSLGGTGTFPQIITPVRNAVAADTVVVAAVGNAGVGTSDSPGNVFETVGVGATDLNEEVPLFSGGETIITPFDWGTAAPPEWPDTYVVPDVAAPGDAVFSARPGGGYVLQRGTSMATPHVSGVLALAHSAAPGDPSVDELTNALYATARKPPGAPAQPDTRYGRGIVDALSTTRELAVEDCVAGDANRDGRVTSLDGTLIQRAIVGLPIQGEFDAACADVDGDGRLTALDVTLLLRSVVGLDVDGTGENVTEQNATEQPATPDVRSHPPQRAAPGDVGISVTGDGSLPVAVVG